MRSPTDIFSHSPVPDHPRPVARWKEVIRKNSIFIVLGFLFGLSPLLSACQKTTQAAKVEEETAVSDAKNWEEAPLAPGLEKATLAGGCFWGMEEIIREIPGVKQTVVGYAGGKTDNPTYEDVKRGDTGYAESIEVVYDPKQLSYEQLLGWFFRMHDPTTVDRQGNDRGSQYRSAIFYQDEQQKKVAEQVKDKVNRSGKWKQPVVTQIVPAGPFYPAEDYHQDYLQKNPGGYTCHYLRD